MVLMLNGKELDTRNYEDRKTIGKHHEHQLHNLLINNGYKFKMSKNEFCCFDFHHHNKDNSIRTFLELKTRSVPINEISVEYVDISKINKYKLIRDIRHPCDICYFYYIFNHITDENHNEYYYFKIDFETIDKYFINEICGKKTYEIPIRDVSPISDLFTF